MNSRRSNRVVVIGLDGATWRIINPLIDAGYMPFIASMKSKGSYTTLKSTIPPLSPPAWTSLVTGVNPGKHNIFEFFKVNEGKVRVVNGSSRAVKAIWEVLSELGRKVLVVNVPMTFPPDRVNGIMVSGMDAPSERSLYVYPVHWKTYLDKIGYKIDFDHLVSYLGDTCLYLAKVLEALETSKEAFLGLADKLEWDFAMIVFTAPDRLQHIFWVADDILDQRNYPILALYRQLDRHIKEIADSLGPANFFLVSDHGFMRVHKGIYVSNVLRDMGLLHVKSNMLSRAFRYLRLTREGVFDVLSKRRFASPMIRLAQLFPQSIRNFPPYKNAFNLDDVDWNVTQAWFESMVTRRNPVIRINPKIRAKSPSYYYNLCNRIRSSLLQIVDRETRSSVIQDVYLSEEVYSGPYVIEAPDLIIQPKPGYALKEGFNDDILIELSDSGGDALAEHDADGIILAWGPHILDAGAVDQAEIVDVVPTILAIMGIPVHEYIDGSPILRLLNLSDLTIQRGRVTYNIVRKPSLYSLSREDETILERRLRDLGYLG